MILSGGIVTSQLLNIVIHKTPSDGTILELTSDETLDYAIAY
jgi:hypothetical protein